MASMPELGSKISLISKSDIRYEGQLYTVDPNECTIALANVRSYGTEDRDGQFAIPPQDEVFDYILFRGSDIKDIRVVNNVPRVPHDPAIMQMHVSSQNPPNFPQAQFSIGQVMPHVGGPVGQFGAGNSHPSPFNSLTSSNAPGGPGLPFGQQQPPQQQQQQQAPQQASNAQSQQPNQQQSQQQQQKNSVLDLIGGGSRPSTPVSLNSRKSPTAEMGVQVNQKDGNRRNNNRGQQGGRMDSQGSHENRNQQRNNQYQGNNQNRGGNWVRNNNQNPRNNNQRPQRRPGLHPQSFRQNINNQNNKGRPKTTIKFESDFDFEQANTKFEEMRLSLAKLKVGEEAKPEQVNGEAEKIDSGNETGAGEQEQEEDDITVGYDKAKSFFDNISCEAATDRKGKNRTDWRLERKLNSETFGVSSARRGGFYNYNRGRPGNNGNYYNNRNSGMNYRNNGYNNGGNNGGYRGGNFRNTRNFQQRNHNQGGNQQENPTTSLPQEKQPTNQQSQSANQAPAVAAGGNK